MSWILGTVGFVLLIIWALTLYDLLRSDAERTKKIAWVLIIVLLPFAGAIAYWVLRPASPQEISEHLGAQADLRRGGPQDRSTHPPSVY